MQEPTHEVRIRNYKRTKLRFRARNASVSATSVTALQSAEAAVKHPPVYVMFAEGYKKTKLLKK